MKIVTWNINGLRSLKTPLKELLDEFNADVVCFQETKIAKKDLTEKLTLVNGYNSYFCCSKIKLGYSGVATFVSDEFTPTYAELGLTGLFDIDPKYKLITNSQPKSETQYNINNSVVGSNHDINIKNLSETNRFNNLLQLCDQPAFIFNSIQSISVKDTAKILHKNFSLDLLKSIDLEGRCVITEHTIRIKDSQELNQIVIVNVYCPRSGDNESRQKFKIYFYQVLAMRCEEILKTGRHVIIVGDINTSHKPIDHCDPELDEIFIKDEGRQWLDSFLIPEINLDVCKNSMLLIRDSLNKSSNVSKTFETVYENEFKNNEFLEFFYTEYNDDFFYNDVEKNKSSLLEFNSNESMKNCDINNISTQNFCEDLNIDSNGVPLKNNRLLIEPQYLEVNKIKLFVDVTRMIFPARRNMFTNWCTFTGARATNYGQRIDYIFADVYIACYLIFSDILPNILGSDHCPVFCTLNCTGVPADNYPKECTKHIFSKGGKQNKIFEYFCKYNNNDVILNDEINFDSYKIHELNKCVNSSKNLNKNEIKNITFIDLTLDTTKIIASNKTINLKKLSNHRNNKLSSKHFKSSLKNKKILNFNKNDSESSDLNLKQFKLQFSSNKINLEINKLNNSANTYDNNVKLKCMLNEQNIKNGSTNKFDEITTTPHCNDFNNEICADNSERLQANTYLGSIKEDISLKELIDKDDDFDLPSSQNSLEYKLLKYKKISDDKDKRSAILSDSDSLYSDNSRKLQAETYLSSISEEICLNGFIDQEENFELPSSQNSLEYKLFNNKIISDDNSIFSQSNAILSDSDSLNTEVVTLSYYKEPRDILSSSGGNNDYDKKKYTLFNKTKDQKMEPVLCKGHKEPCVLRIVKKQGVNKGRKFWTCARPEGHRTNTQARCNYFIWCDEIVKNKKIT